MDGGTAAQCTGTTDAAYPGTGVDQPCAVEHPFWLVKTGATWKIAGGDTVIFGDGSYKIGWGAPNTGVGGLWGTGYGTASNSRVVTFPIVPGGTPESHTRFVGAGWNSGCKTKPEIWGSGGLYQIFNLGGGSSWAQPGSAYVDFECLEITDHAECGYGMGTSTLTQRCESVVPYTNEPWAKTAIYGFYVASLTLNNLYIHGMASCASCAAPVKDYKLTNSVLTGNGGNVALDPGSTDSSNLGTILFEHDKILWGGCIEHYPVDQSMSHHCSIVDAYLNAGDGVGPDHSGGNWIFRDVEVAYSASDGIDLLYIDQQGGTIFMDKVFAHSNGGNQVKVSSGATVTIQNSILVGDCRWLSKSGNPLSPNLSACRAGGHTLAAALPGDTKMVVVNNTITEGEYPTSPFLFRCKMASEGAFKDCNENTAFILQNNIFYGYNTNSPPFQLQSAGAAYPNVTNATLMKDWANNLWFGMRQPCPYYAGMEKNAVCGMNPLLVNPTLGPEFDARLGPRSPAQDAGISDAVDFYGSRRPISIGAAR